MRTKYIATIPDRKILKYLQNQCVFRDSETIYNALKTAASNRAIFEGQLTMLAAKNKILAVKMKDRFVYSMPEKLKTGKTLSGAINSDVYLILMSLVN